jgi:hypothetical protein
LLIFALCIATFSGKWQDGRNMNYPAASNYSKRGYFYFVDTSSGRFSLHLAPNREKHLTINRRKTGWMFWH